MKLSVAILLLALESASAFVPHAQSRSPTLLKGYLDGLIDPNAPDPDPDPEAESREATNMPADQIDRAGPGSWDQFVDFDEFDGGDGQMGVAGDGNSKLASFDMTSMAKSKSMSAKNAWGTSTGYADSLIAKGVDTQRAQQLENWNNQQDVLNSRKEQQKYMTDDYDKTGDDENWRDLSKFGVERNQVRTLICMCSWWGARVFPFLNVFLLFYGILGLRPRRNFWRSYPRRPHCHDWT